MKRRDLTGQRFGRLVAIEDVGRLIKGKESAGAWRWRCDCGIEFVDWVRKIVGGGKMSCGCRKRETQAANISPMTAQKADRHCKDLTGQRFGRLLVTGRDGASRHGRLWTAACDCGNTTTAATSSLLCGMRVSCGCQQKEAGLRNLEKAHAAIRYKMAAKRSRILTGILFKPAIRHRKPSIVHKVEE